MALTSGVLDEPKVRAFRLVLTVLKAHVRATPTFFKAPFDCAKVVLEFLTFVHRYPSMETVLFKLFSLIWEP